MAQGDASAWILGAALCLASLHCRAPKAQSANRPRPVRAAIRLNPQSAMRKVQNRFRRSNLELRRPRTSLKFGPRSSRWGALCAVSRADSESANPQSEQSLAT
eukprot:14306587-Alexandrium_andersonii.AAC.1